MDSFKNVIVVVFLALFIDGLRVHLLLGRTPKLADLLTRMFVADKTPRTPMILDSFLFDFFPVKEEPACRGFRDHLKSLLNKEHKVLFIERNYLSYVENCVPTKYRRAAKFFFREKVEELRLRRQDAIEKINASFARSHANANEPFSKKQAVSFGPNLVLEGLPICDSASEPARKILKRAVSEGESSEPTDETVTVTLSDDNKD